MNLNPQTITGTHPPSTFAASLRVASLAIPLFIAIAVHPVAPAIALVGVSAWSVLGTKQALQSLSLLVLIKFLNKGIYQFDGSFELVAWATLLLAGLRIIYDNMRTKSDRHPVMGWLWLFAFAVIIESTLVSQFGFVSIFKILAFTYLVTVVLLGFKATASQGVDWAPWFLGLWFAVMAVSLPTLLFPEIGYRNNGTGFQGITNQPQVFGVLMAAAVAWLTGTLLFSPYRSEKWLYLLVPLAWSLMIMSAARTAAIAVLVGFFVVLVAALWSRPVWRQRIGRALTRPVSIVLALALLAIVVSQSSQIYEYTLSFVLKGDDAATIERSFESSRGGLIVGQWQDFKENPIFGIGFGISNDINFKPVLDPYFGLPISATIEKGFLPSAILQETGIFGTIFFVLFLLSLIKQAFSRTELILPWVFMTCLLVNIGEAILFSPNGFGLYIWLFMGWAASSRWEKSVAA